MNSTDKDPLYILSTQRNELDGTSTNPIEMVSNFQTLFPILIWILGSFISLWRCSLQGLQKYKASILWFRWFLPPRWLFVCLVFFFIHLPRGLLIAGEMMPCVMIDGKIVGKWHYGDARAASSSYVEGLQVKTQLNDFNVTTAIQKRLDDEVALLQQFISPSK